MSLACPACDCRVDTPAHRLVAALRDDDMDAALDAGLLDSAGCPSCSAACTSALLAARDQRRFALDARERFARRQRRLAGRVAERGATRRVKPVSNAPALPPTAAAVLQRALARAAEKR